MSSTATLTPSTTTPPAPFGHQAPDPKPEAQDLARSVRHPLRIVSWSTDHEVRPSRRTWEALDRVSIPAHHDSLAYRALTAQPDAAALLAAWTLLVQITARLPRPLRGYLVASHGYAYTAADLALMTGFPASFFTRALAFFQSPEVGWLAPALPEAIPAALHEIEDYRAEEAFRQSERAAQAEQRRRQRRPRPSQRPTSELSDSSPEIAEAAAPSDELPASEADFGPIPAEPPPDWRDRLLAVLPPDDAHLRATCERYVWSELSPRLKHTILGLYRQRPPR